MDLNDFIIEIEKQKANKAFLLFETFVSKLLAKYLEERKKPFIYQYSKEGNNGYSHTEYDGFAKEGIDDLKGPTVVEIKLMRSGNNKFIIKRLIETLVKISSDKEINSILLIVANSLSNESKKNIIEIIKSYDIDVKVWDLADLQNISNKYSEFTLDIISNLSKIIVQKTITDSIKIDPNRWIVKREEHLNKLHEAFMKDDLVLFLGAGVSVNSGISTWDNLVSDLFVSLISQTLKEEGVNLAECDKDYIIKQFISLSTGSPLLQARYIRNGLEKKFEQAVSQALYKGVSITNPTSKLIESISKLCLPRRSGIGTKAVVLITLMIYWRANLKKLE